MPPKMKKKGRPKGTGQKVIGLPKKSKSNGKVIIIAFSKKSSSEKVKGQ